MRDPHEVERVDNLMYNGCEPHWHCIHCNGYWPFHCYGKKDLEQMECKVRKLKREIALNELPYPYDLPVWGEEGE